MKKQFYWVSIGLVGLALSVPEKAIAMEDDKAVELSRLSAAQFHNHDYKTETETRSQLILIKDQSYCNGILNRIGFSLKEIGENLSQAGSLLEQVFEECCSCGSNDNYGGDAVSRYEKPVHEIGVDLISQWK